MVVYYQSRAVLEDDELESISSFSELLETLQALTDIPSSSIKLVASGKLLSTDNYDVNALPAKVVMIGSSAPLSIQGEYHHIKDDLTSDALQLRSKHSEEEELFDRRMRAKRQHANPYRFHELQTLSGLKDEDRALEILQIMSTDPGVLAAMKKHKWSVGALCEMYPEGYVGVSDVCVLGLNENKGQKIYLRLRTDDLKGFRKLLTIKKVLYHELAHNEHSDHDDNFYMLMRQIEREVVELDWRKSTKGHVLGRGVQKIYDEEISGNEVFRCAEKVHAEPNSTACHTLPLQENHSSVEEDKRVNVFQKEEFSVSDASNYSVMDRQLDTENTEDVSTTNDPVIVDDCDGHKSIMEETATILTQQISHRIISNVDEMLASYYSLQQEPPDRLVKLRQAMWDMLEAIKSHSRFKEEVGRVSIAQLLETLTLLRDIINRAKNSDDPKYKSLNRTKKLFQRVLAETNALPILHAAGFEEQSHKHDHLQLTSNDPVILYLFADVLNKTIEVSNSVLVDFTKQRC